MNYNGPSRGRRKKRVEVSGKNTPCVCTPRAWPVISGVIIVPDARAHASLGVRARVCIRVEAIANTRISSRERQRIGNRCVRARIKSKSEKSAMGEREWERKKRQSSIGRNGPIKRESAGEHIARHLDAEPMWV